MNVLLISQCSKRALKETRRLLDQFAERRGDRTWQTPITAEGLRTLRKLLRKSARKNTAVACHWIHGHNHSELLWIVGNARRFNQQGATPTNTTSHDMLRANDENDWHTLNEIGLLAQLAALMHDLGKASIAFQQRLKGELTERNAYRHEWVSLRLFQAFVGNDDDTGWLMRLADVEGCDHHVWTDPKRYQRDGLDARDGYPFQHLPPIAQAVGWLIVTHHRLPVVPCNKRGSDEQDWLGKAGEWKTDYLDDPLKWVAHDWNEIRPDPNADIEPYWNLAANLPLDATWRKRAARLAGKLLVWQDAPGHDTPLLDNPWIMHLARLSLMLADHHYSSLTPDSSLRVHGDGHTPLYANTDHASGQMKQPLDEHLIGVAFEAGQIAHALPHIERNLPRLANHRGLRKRSVSPKFRWQDKAADTASALREKALVHGAFIVNMASTGCGKTLGNARIAYALADPQQGMRLTYALGLRTLTMQTGTSYRQDLHLDDDELAVLVGGSASRELFAWYQRQAEQTGSASIQDLIDEDAHVFYEGNSDSDALLSRAMQDPAIRRLLAAPVLTCTVDHMVPATEAQRAGRQIAPMLRLLSSDLVLDELDDYGLSDLPALTRLVHWAGLLGTRVILSSATLPPALVTGMFMAYRQGRKHYLCNRGGNGPQTDAPPDIPCLWVDEFEPHTVSCADVKTFAQAHEIFVAKRCRHLAKAPVLRRGQLWPLDIGTRKIPEQRAAFAAEIRKAALQLHANHGHADPQSNKRVSFGLVRMANITPLFDVARELYRLGAPDDTHIHLCVYHARFPLLQRSAIEATLDATFNRRGDPESVFHLPSIRHALDGHAEQQHIFIVLASPVCEVGRDWDADWAIVEPSSMRSLIQLAGRVQRHRGVPCTTPNMVIFHTNLKHFQGANDHRACFLRPGYEKPGTSKLVSHDLQDLLQPAQWQTIDAVPRVHPAPSCQWRPNSNLADLEHARTTSVMLPLGQTSATLTEQAFLVNTNPRTLLTGVLPQYQPFRASAGRKTHLTFLPDEDDVGEDETCLQLHRVEQVRGPRGKQSL
ncbi:MAG TPA: type I-F CRISPR-associated helicase Cas3f, partial [Rhodanobacteraceae bacterium]